MRRRPTRPLKPEEEALWAEVARKVKALPGRSVPATPKTPPGRPKTTATHSSAERKPAGKAGRPWAPKAAAPAPPVERRLQRALRRGRTEAEARLDLHGLTQAEAHRRLVAFILGAQAEGARVVLVITGKGGPGGSEPFAERPRGVLRMRVPQWLAEPPLAGIVLGVSPAGPRQGGEGALHVLLKRGRGGPSVKG